MRRTDARRLAKQLVAEGKNYRDIAQALAEKGFVSGRTGKAFTPGGINGLVRARGKNGGGRTRRRSRRMNTTTSKGDVIRAITKLTQVDAETRLSLVELVADL